MDIVDKKTNFNNFNVWLTSYFNVIVAVILLLFIGAAYFFVLAPRFASIKETLKISIRKEEILYASNQKKLYTYKLLPRFIRILNLVIYRNLIVSCPPFMSRKDFTVS